MASCLPWFPFIHSHCLGFPEVCFPLYDIHRKHDRRLTPGIVWFQSDCSREIFFILFLFGSCSVCCFWLFQSLLSVLIPAVSHGNNLWWRIALIFNVKLYRWSALECCRCFTSRLLWNPVPVVKVNALKEGSDYRVLWLSFITLTCAVGTRERARDCANLVEQRHLIFQGWSFMGCLWCVHVQQWSTVCIQPADLLERSYGDAKAMLHLQLDVAVMNGAGQEHYMFDPGLSWPFSSSVNSVSRKSISAQRYLCSWKHWISHGRESGFRVWKPNQLENDVFISLW